MEDMVCGWIRTSNDYDLILDIVKLAVRNDETGHIVHVVTVVLSLFLLKGPKITSLADTM